MMWFAFQGLIVCAVITANFFLQATPSGYVVGLAGVLVALGAHPFGELGDGWNRSEQGNRNRIGKVVFHFHDSASRQ
jgi:hypothetical protein